MKKNYFEKAIDSSQYDKGEIDWSEYGKGDDPRRKFFKEALRGEMGDLHGKTVLDIGSGSGAFFDFLNELGADSIQGIEPSKNNLAVSKKLFADIPVFLGGLKDAEFDKKFDVALAVMVFEHFPNLEESFSRIGSFLKEGGKLYLITHDREHMLKPDYDTPIEVEELGGDGSMAVKLGTPNKTFYDILRPVELYKSVGEQAGFKLEKHVPLVPTEALIRALPRYEKYRNTPNKHLFVFKRI